MAASGEFLMAVDNRPAITAKSRAYTLMTHSRGSASRTEPRPSRSTLGSSSVSLDPLGLILWLGRQRSAAATRTALGKPPCNPGLELAREAIKTAEVADRHSFGEPKGEQPLGGPGGALARAHRVGERPRTLALPCPKMLRRRAPP